MKLLSMGLRRSLVLFGVRDSQYITRSTFMTCSVVLQYFGTLKDLCFDWENWMIGEDHCNREINGVSLS